MPIISINALASVGAIQDMEAVTLPFAAWGRAENVQFISGSAASRYGDAERVVISGFAPRALFFTASTLERFLVIAGDDAVHVVITGGSVDDITNAGGPFDAAGVRWTGGTFNGVLVLNNPVDLPQYWVPGTLTVLQDLPNWPSTYRAGVIRPFKNFLVAMDISVTGTRDPHLVKWSHPADPGDLPISWDETDPTRDAGTFPLSDSPGYIVDALPMRDTFIIYKEDAVWAMQLVGGVQIFSFRKIFSDVGMLAVKCGVQLPNGQHAVLAVDDIYVHNGQSWQSIVEERYKRRIFTSIADNAAEVSYVAINPEDTEVMFCVPVGVTDHPNKAFCWNYINNTWSERDLHNTADIGAGVLPETTGGGVAWDDETTETWDEATDIWGERSGAQRAALVYGAYPTSNSVRQIRSGVDFPDGPVHALLERTGLGVPMLQDKPPDVFAMKFFRGLRPQITGPLGEVVQVSLGVQDRVVAAPTWYGPYSYTIGSSEFVDIRGTGRLFSVRFESDGVVWQLHGYDLDVEFGGMF